ncbi:MAG: pyruvate kinase [Tissierellia bacterium]|nr:pyruvate kinase [Tissierellia bacterium]
MRKTKIVCTIGPSSEEEKVLKELIISGLNVARLNFSHGTQEEHKEKIHVIKKVREELCTSTAIMLDTKGPEIRLRDFEKGSAQLVKDQKFTLTTRDIIGNENMASVTYEGLAKDLKVGDTILIDDGLISLEVIEIKDRDLKCMVKNGGIIKNKKGVNVPNVKINLPALTDKDIRDIKFGIEEGIDYIAASFIRKADDVIKIRRILEEGNAGNIMIISKIENRQGVENIDEIIEVSDGIMIARGDLGVEIPAEEVPLVQKSLIKKCNQAGKPVITATQMLDSMIRNPRPTRAEVSDVATAIFEGSDAIMLSGETAMGSYPVEAVKTMARIALMIEKSLNYEEILNEKNIGLNPTITDSISYATCKSCLDLKASAIISATSSGYTAAAVSKFRPIAPIIAATQSEEVMRKLALYWGVYPIKIGKLHSTDDIVAESVEKALELDYLQKGDLTIITAGIPVGVSGATNMLKVHIVSELLYKKVGVGKGTVMGKAVVAKNEKDLKDKFNEGDILVMISTHREVVEYMEKASAIIVEEGGLTSHAIIAGLNLGKEVVVGAENCTKLIKSGEFLTVNGKLGVVYRGQANIK